MKTLQTNNKTRNNKMILRLGKIGLLAFLFIFVFSMVCIVMDANISSSIQNGTFDNIAEAISASSNISLSSLNINNTLSYGNFTSEGWHNGSFSSSENQTITYKCEGFLHGCGDRNGVIYAKCTIATSTNLYKHLVAGASLKVKFSATCGFNSGNADDWGLSIQKSTPSSSNTTNDGWASGFNPLAKSSWEDDKRSDSCTATLDSSCTTFYVAIHSNADGAWAIGWNSIKLTTESCSYSYTVSFLTDGNGTTSPRSANITGNATSETKASSTASANTGYHFVKWTKGNTSTSAGTSTTLEIGSSDFFSYSSYKANFTKNNANIRYNKNAPASSIVSGSITNTPIVYSETFTLADSGFTCNNGYTLVGWSKTSSGDTDYALGESLPSTATQNGFFDLSTYSSNKIFDLYAVWKKSDFDILNGKTRNWTSGDVENKWGGANNPFVISSQEHLKNLSRVISRDDAPVDSITSHSILNYTTKATDYNYTGCYFLVTATNISAFNYIIGTDSSYY